MNSNDAIENLDQQIRWIEEIKGHQFHGWLNVTNAMRDAIAILTEQNNQIHHMGLIIEEYEKECKHTHGQKRSGNSCGIFEGISEKRR
jgi:hypothetical protein